MGGFVPPGFEGRFRPSGPPEMERPFSLEDAELKAEDVLKRSVVRMEDFDDLYGSEVIARDQKYVTGLKETFARQENPQIREAKRLATILEAALLDQVNNNKWFGQRAKSLRTTEYDDIVNGVDSVLEFSEPSASVTYMGLGIDVTYSHDLTKKFERIKQEIDGGKLATIKYLKSSDGSFRGEQRQVPRLVVALDGENTNALAKAWYKNAPGLAENPVRFQLVEELLVQLQTFEEYSRRVGQKELAEKYKVSKMVMERVRTDIDRRQGARRYDVSDRSSVEIRRKLMNFM